MASIDQILTPYSELETDIQRLMKALFSETCGICTACCCRADICEEAVESAFLNKLLQRQQLTPKDMDERFGWLDLHGCSLDYGRPPICYAFFCDELLARLPDEETRYAVKILGNLIHHVGHRALGSRHLVEIMEEADLEEIDRSRLLGRLEEARNAFAVIEQFVESGFMSKAQRELLSRIITDEP